MQDMVLAVVNIYWIACNSSVHVERKIKVTGFDISTTCDACVSETLRASQFQKLLGCLREFAPNTRDKRMPLWVSPFVGLVLSSPALPSSCTDPRSRWDLSSSPSLCRRVWLEPWGRNERLRAATCRRRYPDCRDWKYWSRLVERLYPDMRAACNPTKHTLACYHAANC